MTSYKLFSHSQPLGAMVNEIEGLFNRKPPFDIKHVIWRPFCFGNQAKITIRLALLAIYLLCKFDEATNNISRFRASLCVSNNRLWRPYCFHEKWGQNLTQTCFHSHKHSLQIWWRYLCNMNEIFKIYVKKWWTDWRMGRQTHAGMYGRCFIISQPWTSAAGRR